jgi:hypothetical protein
MIKCTPEQIGKNRGISKCRLISIDAQPQSIVADGWQTIKDRGWVIEDKSWGLQMSELESLNC